MLNSKKEIKEQHVINFTSDGILVWYDTALENIIDEDILAEGEELCKMRVLNDMNEDRGFEPRNLCG